MVVFSEKIKAGKGMRRGAWFIMVVMIAMATWGSWNEAGAADPRHGGVLEFGMENEFSGFDAIKTKGGIAINTAIANNAIHEQLFRFGDKGEIVPVLGLSATSSEDGKAWTIKLRQGVSFHDGTPFNADAVVHHWKRLMDPENRFRGRMAFKPLQSVEKVDEYTVRFQLNHPWLLFERILCDNRTFVGTIPSPKAVDDGVQNRAPVGTGPFMFKEWTSGDRFVVVRNPNYWQKGKPYLDEIIFRPMPDSQTRFASLQAGGLGLIWMDRGNIIEKARKDKSLKVLETGGSGAEIMVLNTSRPPLDDIRVRRALAHANNQAMHVKMVYQNCIPVIHDPFGVDSECGDDGYLEHDLEKAKKLIREYGKPVELEILHSNSKRGRAIGELMQQLYKKIGVKVTPVGLKFGPVIKRVISGSYQMSTWRMPAVFDHGAYFYSAFNSKSRSNWTHYANPRMDELVNAQATEPDTGKRKEILCEIAKILNEDVPILYRGGKRFYVLARDDVKGAKDFRNGILRLADVWMEE